MWSGKTDFENEKYVVWARPSLLALIVLLSLSSEGNKPPITLPAVGVGGGGSVCVIYLLFHYHHRGIMIFPEGKNMPQKKKIIFRTRNGTQESRPAVKSFNSHLFMDVNYW